MRFDFLGIDILTGGEDDDVLGATGDEYVVVLVEAAEVAGEQPAIVHDSGSCIGPVVVALHHDAAANRDFANHVAGLGILLRLVDTNFIARQWLTYGSDYVVSRSCNRGGAAGFREAVGVRGA